MKQVPGCITLGAQTGGSSGYPRAIDLGNGTAVAVPRWQALRLDSTCFEGDRLGRPAAPQPELAIHPAGGFHRGLGVDPGAAVASFFGNYEGFPQFNNILSNKGLQILRGLYAQKIARLFAERAAKPREVQVAISTPEFDGVILVMFDYDESFVIAPTAPETVRTGIGLGE